MDAHHLITNNPLTLETIQQVVYSDKKLKLSDDAIERILKCRRYLDEKMTRTDRPIYGINTGFGSLYNVKIEDADLTTLQENLMRSHACGM